MFGGVRDRIRLDSVTIPSQQIEDSATQQRININRGIFITSQ